MAGASRSDFSNQVNNVLAFPGIFRGALDCQAEQITCQAEQITELMKIAAAHSLADVVLDPTPERVLPETLDRSVAPRVAAEIVEAYERKVVSGLPFMASGRIDVVGFVVREEVLR